MAKVILVLVLLTCRVYGFPSSDENAQAEERIIGGNIASEGQFPYQISLRTGNNQHFCGGSIISNTWILTAAHCVHGSEASKMFVAVGTNYLNQGGTGYRISQIVSHPNYDQNNNQNDIAILLVAGSITFNAKVQPIKLANTVTKPGISCTLSGWGLTNYPSNDAPNLLQYIHLTAISITQCKTRLSGFPISSTNVCTYLEFGKGACKGDSGGPLCCEGVQHGVVSWGIPCAKGSPDVFTSVAAYRSWITLITGI